MKPILTADLQDWLVTNKHAKAGLSAGEYIDAVRAAIGRGDLSIDKYAELIGTNTRDTKMTAHSAGPSVSDIANTAGGGTGGAGIRVKRASERYSTKSTTVINKMTGQPLVVFGSPVETPSEASYARIGAWFKHFLRSQAETLRRW